MSGILAAAFAGGRDAELVLNISEMVNPNIVSLLSTAGWNNRAPVKLYVAPSAKVNKITIPNIDFPQGLSLYVSAGALIASSDTTTIYTRRPIIITNDGQIRGRGGDGGSGGDAWVEKDTGPDAGYTVWGYGGSGGWGQRMANGSTTVLSKTYGDAGSSGTARGSGFGGDWDAYATGGDGGGGSDFGDSGYSGSAGSISGGYSRGASTSGGNGMPPGWYIDGDAYVTWAKKGDVKGSVK